MSYTELGLIAIVVLTASVLIFLLVYHFGAHLSRTVKRRRLEKAQPETLATLRAERDRLKAEYAMVVRKLEHCATNLKDHFVAQEAELARASNRIGELEKELRETRRTLQARERSNASLQAKNSELKEKLDTHVRQLRDERKKGRMQEAALVRLEAERDSAREEVARLNEALRRHKKELAGVEGRLGAAQAEVAALKKAVSERDAEIIALKKDIDQYEATIAGLQEQVQKEQAAARENALQVSTLREQIDELKKTRKSLKARAAAEKREKEKAQGELKLRQKELAIVQKEFARFRKAMMDEGIGVDRLMMRIQSLQELVEGASTSRGKAARRRRKAPAGTNGSIADGGRHVDGNGNGAPMAAEEADPLRKISQIDDLLHKLEEARRTREEMLDKAASLLEAPQRPSKVNGNGAQPPGQRQN